MRHTKLTLTALTCTFMLLSAGVASAGSGPAPADPPVERESRSTAPSPEGNPLSPRARTAEVCSDAHEIGTTGRVVRDGVQIASVKQFYSAQCQENYAYLWVWESYRDQIPTYDVAFGLYSYDQDRVLASQSIPDTQQYEFWSAGAATVQECTAAVGAVRTPGEPLASQGHSSKRC